MRLRARCWIRKQSFNNCFRENPLPDNGRRPKEEFNGSLSKFSQHKAEVNLDRNTSWSCSLSSSWETTNVNGVQTHRKITEFETDSSNDEPSAIQYSPWRWGVWFCCDFSNSTWTTSWSETITTDAQIGWSLDVSSYTFDHKSKKPSFETTWF